MKLYYCTRYEHRIDRETEYYCGAGTSGYWQSLRRCSDGGYLALKLFGNELAAKRVIQDVTDADWHEVEIRN